MYISFSVLILLLLLLFLAHGSQGAQEVCRQRSAQAQGQWKLGDTFAFCALRDGHNTFVDFNSKFEQIFFPRGSGTRSGTLIGHNDNVRSLQRTFSSWISSYYCKQSLLQKTLQQPCFKPHKPLYVHLSGPSGVGKTLFADLVSSILFKERRRDEHDQQRELHYCGHSIHELSLLDRDAAYVDLRDSIYQQLHHCPFSLFVLKNAHLADMQQLLKLLSLLKNGSFPGSEGDESIKSAMFMFTSDFGAYNGSHGIDEARINVRAAVQKLFADELRRNSQLKPMVQSFFLDNVETFLPLTSQELGQVAELEMMKMQQELHRHRHFQAWKGDLKCDSNCSIHIAKACFRNQYDCASRMVYGLKQFLTDELYPKMFAMKFSNPNFDSSDMHIVIEHDDLQLRPVEILAKSRKGAASADSNIDL
jgi:DNA polymerase III delta prime subunit